MSLSDASSVSQGSSNDSIPSTVSSKEDPVTPFHPTTITLTPATSDSAHPLYLNSKQQQDSEDISPQISLDGSLNISPLDCQTDELPLIIAEGKGKGKGKGMDMDMDMGIGDSGEEGGGGGGGEEEEEEEEDPGKTPEELMKLMRGTRQRNREPAPGTKRVMKTVRVRKGSSSSKRRTKKHNLRVQLKETTRIEEEMAGYRGKEGKKWRPITERRQPPIIGSDTNSRGRPSGLRFSESCYSDKEDEEEEGCQDGKGRIMGVPENPEAPMELQQQNLQHESNPEASINTMEWKSQTSLDIV